jgi:hypothetical protein
MNRKTSIARLTPKSTLHQTIKRKGYQTTISIANTARGKLHSIVKNKPCA